MGEPDGPVETHQPNLNHEQRNAKIKKSWRSSFAQVLATLIQNCLFFVSGMDLAIPPLVLGSLHRNPAEPLNMNDDQASWFVSLLCLTYPLGSLTSGLFQDKLGRKGVMLLINIPTFAAWLLLYFASSVYELYAVGIIVGLCIGISDAPLHLYTGEIGEPHLRGTLSTLTTSAIVLGTSFMFFIGYLVDWRTAILIGSAFPVVASVLMTQMPESPAWLITKNRLEEARKSLCWLRGWIQPEEVETEFQALVEYTKNSSKESKMEPQNSEKDGNTNKLPLKEYGYLMTELKVITNKVVLRPFQLVMVVYAYSVVNNLSGYKPYAIRIINEFGTPVKSNLIMVIAQTLFFLGTVMNMVFLRRFGKRKIALFSFGLTTLAILGLGAYCSFYKNSGRQLGISWIPIALLLAVDFFSGFSVTLLPWQIISEVFPPLGRGTASGIAGAWGNFLSFSLIKSFLYVEAWIDISGVFYFYGALGILGLIFLYYCLPETEGKTLAQIATYFTKDCDRKEKFSMGN